MPNLARTTLSALAAKQTQYHLANISKLDYCNIITFKKIYQYHLMENLDQLANRIHKKNINILQLWLR